MLQAYKPQGMTEEYAKRDKATLFTGNENFDLAALDEM